MPQQYAFMNKLTDEEILCLHKKHLAWPHIQHDQIMLILKLGRGFTGHLKILDANQKIAFKFIL